MKHYHSCPKCKALSFNLNACYAEGKNYSYYECAGCDYRKPTNPIVHFLRIVLRKKTYLSYVRGKQN